MSTRLAPAMGPVEWGLLVALSVLWGGSFLFVEVALAGLAPFSVVLARVGLAALALQLAVLVVGRRMPVSLAAWRPFFVMGALNNLLPFCLIVWAQTRITGGLASILNATTPLFTVLLGHRLTRDEPMTARRLAGVALGFLGVAVLLGADLLAGLGDDALAQLAVLGAAVSYALAGLFGRRFRAQPAIVTAAGQVSATTAMLLPIALLHDRLWTLPMPGAATWGALLGLALFSTALAYVVYFRLLATAGAVNLLLVTFLIPVSALLLGAAFLGERLEPRQFAGMALIGLGLAAIDGRLVSRLRRRRPQLSGPRRSA